MALCGSSPGVLLAGGGVTMPLCAFSSVLEFAPGPELFVHSGASFAHNKLSIVMLLAVASEIISYLG